MGNGNGMYSPVYLLDNKFKIMIVSYVNKERCM